MKIRVADVSDVDSLFELNKMFNGDEITTEKIIADSISNNKQETVFVAIVDNETVGFCCVQLFKSMCYDSNYVEITELFVEEECRNQGIATALMKYTEEYFLNRGIKGYQLFTGKYNEVAQAFYENIGYKKSNEIMYRKRL